MLRVLISDAQRRKTPPAIPGLYDLRRWRQRWENARTASDSAAGRSPRIPGTACPYQGLAAFEAADQARFFGRTRSIGELVALITKARAADPGIVLLTGPSGAGKSSLLSAGLVPAVSSGALEKNASKRRVRQSGSGSEGGWVTARMTPGSDPAAELQQCLDQPDVTNEAISKSSQDWAISCICLRSRMIHEFYLQGPPKIRLKLLRYWRSGRRWRCRPVHVML
jgi:hypothetical protein